MSERGHRGVWWRASFATGLLVLAGCAHRSATRPVASARPPATSSPSAQKSDHRYAQDQDSQPTGPPPDLSKIPEPIPRAEPKSVYGNKSPYEVLGQTYTVLPSAQGYV